LKAHVGHYIVNNIPKIKEVDEIIKKMKFKLSFTWSCDPLGIISRLRVKQKTTPYAHTPRREIDKYAN